jgi:hypothetical protein
VLQSTPLKRNLVPRFDNKIRGKSPGDIAGLMRISMSLVLEQRWMYTWKAKTIKNWNTKQTYNPTRVQQMESNISRKWVRFGDIRLDSSCGLLLNFFFGTPRRQGKACSARQGIRGLQAKSSRREGRAMARSNSNGEKAPWWTVGKGENFLFMGRHRGAVAMVLKATWRRGRLIDAVVLARGTVVAGIEMPRRRDCSHGGMCRSGVQLLQ